jgi:hypothetical protein
MSPAMSKNHSITGFGAGSKTPAMSKRNSRTMIAVGSRTPSKKFLESTTINILLKEPRSTKTSKKILLPPLHLKQFPFDEILP